MKAAAVPALSSPIREALLSCASRGNQLAIDALETIRRLEAGEPVGDEYRRRLEMLLYVSDLDPLPTVGSALQ